MAKLSAKEYQKLHSEFSKLAESKDGKHLSAQFLGTSKYHLWYCNKHDYIWKAKPTSLKDFPSKKGTWCPKCAIESLPQNNFKYTIEDMQKLAESKPGGGFCLSNKYKGMTEYHLWKCGTCGHIWEARPHDINGKPTRPNGAWCPQCAEGRFERVVRVFFEALFEVSFSKEKNLEWLRKHKLHLDGYNKELKIAFECQGIQHYQFIDHFHCHDRNVFERRLWIDEYKRKHCKKEGIILIEVGYERKNGVLRKIKYDEMESYIRKKCKENGIEPKRKKPIIWRDFDVSLPNYIEGLQRIAHKRNGELLSKNYFGKLVPLIWLCKKHHFTWRATPNDICGKPSNPNGTWCPRCAQENRSLFMKQWSNTRPRDNKGRFIGKKKPP